MAHKTLTTALTVMALGLSMNAVAFTPDMTEVDGRSIPMIKWDTTLEKFQFQKDKFIGQRFTAMCLPTKSKRQKVILTRMPYFLEIMQSVLLVFKLEP